MTRKSKTGEPLHRKETIFKVKTKIPTNLVASTSDSRFRLDVLELEIKLLNLNLLLSQHAALNKRQSYSSESDNSSEEETEEGEEYDTVSNSLPDSEHERINNKFEVKDFNVAIMNPGGLHSKRESILNVVHKLDIRALIVSETHAVGKEVPTLDNTMEAFYKNKGGSKGGVSIFLEKTLAKHSVVVGKSNHDHEWIAVKINYFDPPVVMIGLYGCQTSRNTVEEMKSKWAELWDFADQYKDSATVIIGGDANAAIGTKVNMVNNCPSTNTNGKFFLKGIRKGGWKILNSLYRGDQRTHEDRSSDSFRCLDYIVTNSNKCTRVFVDNENIITPYRVMTAGPTPARRYTDHKTVMCTFRLEKREKVSVGPAPPIIVRNEEGDARFREYTGELAEQMLELLNSGSSILTVLKTVMRKIKEAERTSYLRIRVTRIKRKMWSDNEAYMKLTRDLEAQAERVMNNKTNDKIFQMRGQRLLKERHEEVTSMFNDRGELVEDRESILEVLTQYNEKLLGRVPHIPDFEEIHRMKKRVVDTLDKTLIKDFNTLTPREFLRAIQRIQNKNKNMFKQFMKLHPRLQALFFFIFKQMYEEEVCPDDFRITFLIALFKKNDPRDPANYRYLHMKSDLSRLYELLVYLKLESHFDSVTAESQMGGRKDGDTVEHLAMLTSIIKDREEQGGGAVLGMVDAVKCFDRSWLSDNHAILQLEGADRKALKVMYKLSSVNKVNVAGCDKTFIQEDGVGQGSVGGARITTSAITECTERHVNRLPAQLALVHRGIQINQQGFVDDVILPSDNSEGARVSNKLYTDTLNELAMSAHPTKSVQVITGNTEWVKSIKEELAEKPCILQGFPVKSTACDKYLGMWFVEGTYRETIDKNIKAKHGLMQKAATEIRNMVDMPEIKRFGKAAAQKLLAQSQIVPICIYATQAWINIEEDQYKALEDSFRDSLTTIMSVPKQTNYAALLKVNNLIHMECFVDMVKLKMWNYKYNVKASGRMFRALQHEVNNGVRGGLAEDLMNLCSKYKLHNLFEKELDPDVITMQCRQTSYRRQWRDHLSLRSVPMMLTSDKVRSTSSEYPENLSRALIMRDLGLLILKTTCPHQFLERNMSGPKDRTCIWAPLCTNTVDSYEHLFECPYYTTKYREMSDPVLAEATFLDRISRERNRRFSQPLILYGNDYENYDPVLDEPCVKYDNVYANNIVSSLMSKYDGDEWENQKCDKNHAKVVPSLTSQCVREIVLTDTWLPRADTEPDSKWWRLSHAVSDNCQVTGVAQIITGSKAPKTGPQSLKQFVTSLSRALNMEGSAVRNLKVFENLRSLPMESTCDLKIETYTNECLVSVTSSDKARCHAKWYGWEESDEGGMVKYAKDILLKEGNMTKEGAANQVTLTVVRYERASNSPETVKSKETDTDATDTESMTSDSEEREYTANTVPTKLTASPESDEGDTKADTTYTVVESSLFLSLMGEERAETEAEGDRSPAQPQE